MTYKELADEFKSLPDDTARWKWVLERKESVGVECDNDWTGVSFLGDDNEDPYIMEFDDYIGWSGGIFHLLKAIGISASSV